MSDEAGDFNWVKARHACSIGNMFEKLRLDVKSDIEMQQQFQERTGFGFVNGFTFVSRADRFSATGMTPNARLSIIFVLSNNEILVQDETDSELFRVRVTLNNDKECRFVVGQEELE